VSHDDRIGGRTLRYDVVIVAVMIAALPAIAPAFSYGELDAPATSGDFESAVDSLSVEIAIGASGAGLERLAVAEFSDLHGTVSELGQFLAEELVTRLYRQGDFEVIDRRLLYKVMQEQALAASGIIDASTASALGRILGADAIATGTITDVGDRLRVNARLIAVESGLVVTAASVDLPRSAGLLRLIAKPARFGPGTGMGLFPPHFDPAQRGQALMAWAAEATGVAHLGELSCVQSSWTVTTPPDAGETEYHCDVDVRYPDCMRMETTAGDGKRYTLILNGDRGWVSGPDGNRDLTDEQIAEFQRSLLQDVAYLLGRHPYLSCREIAPDQFASTACRRVQIEGVTADPVVIWFDERTMLPVIGEGFARNPATGEKGPYRTELRDYADFGGLTLPRESRTLMGGTEVDRTHLDAFTAGMTLPPELFEKD
jgi:TolB-like protein